jgi:hypothetical protein
MTFGLDAFNVLNRVNDVGYIGTLSSPFLAGRLARDRRGGCNSTFGPDSGKLRRTQRQPRTISTIPNAINAPAP